MAAQDPQPNSSISQSSGRESSGGGGVLTRKLGPLPTWVWLLIMTAAGVGFWLWSKSHSAAKSTGSGSGTTGERFVPSFVIQNYDQEPPGVTPPRRRPPVNPGGPDQGGGDGSGGWKQITVPAKWDGWTLSQIAKYLHWTPETLSDVISANAQGGKHVTASTVYHTGDTLIRPIGEDNPGGNPPKKPKPKGGSGG